MSINDNTVIDAARDAVSASPRYTVDVELRAVKDQQTGLFAGFGNVTQAQDAAERWNRTDALMLPPSAFIWAPRETWLDEE